MNCTHYCTYFDSNYLPRALALYHSLRRHGGGFTLDVLCLDECTYDILTSLALAGVRLLRLQELEASDPELARAKADRSWVEYLWTLTPILVMESLKRTEVEMVSYLDADLYFYSSPDEIFKEFGDGSIMLIPHRYARRPERAAQLNGIFNVGMMCFRKNSQALEALQWWRERCLTACHADPRDGKFGDQKYLDDWPDRFKGVKIIAHKGANLAPWNVAGFTVTRRNGAILVDDQPLIFYHFHKLDILGRHWFRSGMRVSRADISVVYKPYLVALVQAYDEVRKVRGEFACGIARPTLPEIWRWCIKRRLTLIYLP